ncbi:MAG: phosphatidylglycerophosphatase A [Pseudomonadota bacterium]
MNKLKLAKFIGTWFYVGLAPKAAGTFGSIAALPFAWAIQAYLGNVALFVASIIAFIGGVVACNIYLPFTSSQDPREMVIDAVAGQWFLLAFMPLTLKSYLVGLLLFRFFDILKPYPISWADKNIHGGFGVMFDDIMAAIYPLVIFALLYLLGYGSGIIAFLGS